MIMLPVAPYVGAWIETVSLWFTTDTSLSHPTWVRGLKPTGNDGNEKQVSRTLRGCVD